jgi:glycerol-3-phosphate dehydrogenase
VTDAFPLRRDVAGLQRGEFDVLVVGGGIYGAWTAYDAARRGLKTALVDSVDWGAGTSAASSKLIHGGLRYLENFEFSLVRHALIERRVLSRLAPHLVRPINFVLPLWRGARVGPTQLSLGLTLYDWLSWGWQPVQRHKRYRAERLLARYPFLARDGLRTGFRYGDCQEDDARLVTIIVAAAQAAGAVCANHVHADALMQSEGKVIGAHLRDTESGAAFEVRARCTVGTVGPWIRELAGDATPAVKFVKGTHVVMPGIPDCHSAFLLTSPQDGRVFFVIPYYNRTLVGTTEVAVRRPADAQPSEQEIRYLLASAHAWMPGLNWSESDVIRAFAGIRTLQDQDAGTLSKVSREFEIRSPLPGLILPIGGKYTTARHDASRVVDRIASTLGLKQRCETALHPLPGAPTEEFGLWLEDARMHLERAGLDTEAAAHAALRHGSRVPALCARLREDRRLAERIVPDCPFAMVEARIAIDDEMALTTDDILRRRLPIALLSTQVPTAIERVKALLHKA